MSDKNTKSRRWRHTSRVGDIARVSTVVVAAAEEEIAIVASCSKLNHTTTRLMNDWKGLAIPLEEKEEE